MAPRTYANLDVRVQRAGDSYLVRVADSPVGETGPVAFEVPFSEERLELLLMHLEPWRVRTRRTVDAPTGAAQELGGDLFAALFRGEVRDALVGSLSRVGDGLRIRLDLTEAPDLAGLPWELLYDRGTRRHLALSERTPIVRYLQLPGPNRPLPVSGPLRVLAILSSPAGHEPLDVDAEWAGVEAALRPQTRAGLISLDRLERPTLGHLHRYLRAHEVHLLHFVGHGDYDVASQDGVLYFEDDRGIARKVSTNQLAPLLYDHDPLRLVVLNACQTALPNRADAYSGMAQGLVQQGVPAVVAMQVPITDDAGICFSRDFYTAIAASQPVDQALTGARKALFNDFGYEWATPVLFLRSSDGVLFTMNEPGTAVPKEEPTSPPAPPPPSQAPQAEPKAVPAPASRQRRSTPPPTGTSASSGSPSTPPSTTGRAVVNTSASTTPPAPLVKAKLTRSPLTAEVAPSPVKPATQTKKGPRPWEDDPLMRVRTRTAAGEAVRTWGSVLKILDALTDTPGEFVVLNRLKHSQDTYIQARPGDSHGWTVEYQYGSVSRHYLARVGPLDDVKLLLHAWLKPPGDPSARHQALVQWTRVAPRQLQDERTRAGPAATAPARASSEAEITSGRPWTAEVSHQEGHNWTVIAKLTSEQHTIEYRQTEPLLSRDNVYVDGNKIGSNSLPRNWSVTTPVSDGPYQRIIRVTILNWRSRIQVSVDDHELLNFKRPV